MEHADEISNAITAANLGEQVDDDELLAELDQMAQEELDERMLGAPAAPITATPGTVKPGMFFSFFIFFCRLLFPVEDVWLTRALLSVTVAVPKKAVEDDEEEELRKLQAEMAM